MEEKKLNVLRKITDLFEAEKICYAIGGSFMLKVQGVVADYHDFDVVVKVSDVLRAKEILASLGQSHPQKPKAPFFTYDFSAYTIEGVEIDLMAGLVIKHHHIYYAYQFNEACCHYQTYHDIKVSIGELEDWHVLYCLMQRRDKEGLLAHYLSLHKRQYRLAIKVIEKELVTNLRGII